MSEKITNITERFIYLLDLKKISMNKLSQEIEVSNSYFSKMVRKKGGFGSEIVEKILRHWPDVSAEWFITGHGSPIKAAAYRAEIAEEPEVRYDVKKYSPGEGIPLITVEAFAGGYTGDIQCLEHECERYVVPLFRDADFLISVKGNSMYAKYSSGDIVACRRLQSWSFFQFGKVYVIYTEQGVLIKRVYESDDEDMINIVSENRDKYHPFLIHRGDIKALAIVVGVIRLE